MRKESAKRIVGLVLREGLAVSLTDEQLLLAYLRDRSAEAFAEIVRRHGGLVFNVCRRVLAHDQDAEDAFQATFFVLARKAGAIRSSEALAGWLCGVAFRTAQKAKSRRNRERERRTAMSLDLHPDSAAPREPGDWLTMLDQEINRLSERERLPIVFCDLMGRSRREAAEELGLPEGTLSSRLARARERLRVRLLRRGVVPAVAAGAIANRVSATPGPLIELTTKAATTAVSPNVALLAKGVIRNMFMYALTKTLSVVIGLTAISGLVLWFVSPSGTQPKSAGAGEIVAATSDQDEPAKAATDQELIQGTWTVKDAETDGRRDHPNAKALFGAMATFRNDRFVFSVDGKIDSATSAMAFELDSSKTPKEIEFVDLRDQTKGERTVGIYELNGDVLKMRLGPWGNNLERPKDFKTTKDSAFHLVVFKRQKDAPAKPKSARVTELQKELIEALQLQIKGLEERFEAGRDSLIIIFQASNALMEAQLEMATGKKQRLEVIEANLKRFQQYEKIVKQQLDDGKRALFEFGQAKARRLEIEILLTKEKGE